MSEHPDQRAPAAEPRERTVEDVLWARVERRRERIRAEISDNRSGGHRIPTWMLAAALGLLVAGWLCLLVTG